MTLAQDLNPKVWEEYFGFTNMTNRLKESIIKDINPGAIFISSTTGIGKTAVTCLFIKSGLCLNRKPDEHNPCGYCENCKSDPRTHDYDGNVIWVQRGSGDTISSQVNLAVQSAYTPATPLSMAKPGKKYIVFDECFPPEVEVLTNKGFIRFDSLNKSELIAQFNSTNNEISFIKPIRYIENNYEGKLINLNKQKTLSLSTTPNHNLLVYNSRLNSYIKDTCVNTKLTPYTYFKSCGYTNSQVKTTLSWLDKLMIAYQADGSTYHVSTSGENFIAFSFSKQRKIDKFLNIMCKGNFIYSEITGSEQINNKKAQRRFLVKNIQNVSKDISQYFNLNELSLNVCKEIIEEMVCWDGYINTVGEYYYSSTLKANVDFYQAVALMCNYHTNQTVQKDNRSSNFNDVYRLFITKNKNKISCQNTVKTEINYSGKVYCVEVPTGNIIVRNNGKVVITGNCNTIPKDKLSEVLFLCEISDLATKNNVTFIFITMDEKSINENICKALKSRCGAFYFKLPTPTKNQIIEYTLNKFPLLSIESVELIAQYSFSYRSALQTVEMCMQNCVNLEASSIGGFLGFADKDIRKRLWNILENCNQENFSNYRIFKDFWEVLVTSVSEEILLIQLEEDIEKSLYTKPNANQLIALDALLMHKVKENITLQQSLRSLMGLSIIDFNIFN